MKKIVDTFIAVTCGLLYVLGTLGVSVIIIAIFTDVLDVKKFLWKVESAVVVFSFVLAVAGFCYLSKSNNILKTILIASLFPFALLSTYGFFIFLFEKIGIGGGKGPIFFAILPTILISLIVMFISNRLLTKSDA